LKKLDNRSSENVNKKLIRKLVKFKYQIYTFTFDNDKGFIGHKNGAKALQA